MQTTPHQPEQTDAALRDAAAAYARLGWRVVPVEFRGKKPTDGNGWQTERYRRTLDQIWAHWHRPFNVGVLLGPESGELVDVDLDCPEALELADEILPPGGFVFGRASAHRSHRLYRSPGAALLQLKDLPEVGKTGAGPMLVELRAKPSGGVGAQTVLPPSVHKTGERIEWDADAGDALELPRLVEPAELSTAVRRVAVGAFLARHLGGADAARRWLADEKAGALRPGTLKPEVAAHVRELLGLPPVVLPKPPQAPPPRREVKDGEGLGEGWQDRFNAAGIGHAAGLLGLAWDGERRTLARCPHCGMDTRSSSDKRAAVGVVKATKPGGNGDELWTHGKCNVTDNAVGLACCVLLGTKRPTRAEQWRELEKELRARGWT